MKITAVLLKLGQTRVIISPMSPKITAKTEKREREREREKKKLATVFSFYSVDFGRSLTDPFSERPGFHKSRYISPWYGDSDREKYQRAISGLRGRILEHVTAFAGDNYLHGIATVIGKNAKKQFPAYVGEFWSMSQRLLEMYSWIYENMIDKNYSSFTKTGPNKGNYKPDEPENHSKERKEVKGARAREKKTSNSL